MWVFVEGSKWEYTGEVEVRREMAGIREVGSQEGLPSPFSPIMTLSRTAQAPPPPSLAAASCRRGRRSPRPLCPSPFPNPAPLLSHLYPPLSPPPLLHVDSEQIRLHVSLRGTCRGTGSGPLPSSQTPPPPISGCELQVLSLFLLLGMGSLGCNFLKTGAVGCTSYYPL